MTPAPAHGLFRDHPPPSLPLLLEWVAAERGFINPGVHVADIPDAGWGLVADVDLQPHELLFNIPVTAILSARTSSLGPLPSSSRTKSISGPILDLALHILHELRQDRGSRWYGYLQSLPRETVLLPVMWDLPVLCGQDGRRGMEWLKGTEAARDLSRKASDGFSIQDLQDYYNTHMAHLPPTEAHPEASPFAAYLHAFALVTTRAFLIDLYHTIALVPFADILNHSSTTPHTSMSSDSFVCHICGSLAPCSHDILAPDGIPFRLQEASRDPADYARMITAENTVEMRLEAHVDAAEEVMNCYGADMGDARLLVEWGYLPEEFCGDGLTWSRDELQLSERAKKLWLDLLAGGLEERLRTEISTDEDLLICPPREGTRGTDLFNLSNAGQIGANLWTLLFLQNSEMPSATTGEIMDEVLQAIEEVEGLAQEETGGTCRDTTRGAITAVVRLLEQRVGELHRPDLSIEALFELRDKLPPESKLQRMAMPLSINERSLLESTLHKWRDLSQLVEAHVLPP